MFKTYLIIYIENLNKIVKYRKKKKKKNYLRYLIEHLKDSINNYNINKNYQEIQKRIINFVDIKQYYKYNIHDINNEDYYYYVHYFINKKINFKNISINNDYNKREFYTLISLWKSQLLFSFVSAIQINGEQSLIIINTLESIFRLIAKDNNINILTIKNNNPYDLENHDALPTVLDKLYKNNIINEYEFIYYIIHTKNLRNIYCHGKIENISYKETSYICLMFIYIMFIRKNKNV